MAPHVNTAIKVYKLITNVCQFGHDVVIFYMIIFKQFLLRTVAIVINLKRLNCLKKYSTKFFKLMILLSPTMCSGKGDNVSLFVCCRHQHLI